MNGFFEIKKTNNGRFQFHLKQSNGEIILSSEIYKQKASAQNGIISVQKNSGFDDKYSRLKNKNDKFYFTLKAANFQVIGVSPAFTTEKMREEYITQVKAHGATTVIKDLTKRSTSI